MGWQSSKQAIQRRHQLGGDAAFPVRRRVADVLNAPDLGAPDRLAALTAHPLRRSGQFPGLRIALARQDSLSARGAAAPGPSRTPSLAMSHMTDRAFHGGFPVAQRRRGGRRETLRGDLGEGRVGRACRDHAQGPHRPRQASNAPLPLNCGEGATHGSVSAAAKAAPPLRFCATRLRPGKRPEAAPRPRATGGSPWTSPVRS